MTNLPPVTAEDETRARAALTLPDALVTAPVPRRRPLACQTCGLPFATVQDDVLIITSYHHGEKHVNTLSLARVCELLQGE